jgi:hypothetical protein
MLSILAAPVAAASVTVTPPAQPTTVTGTIELAICGELDPFELGDACVVYGTASDGSPIGLVTDLGLIDEHGYDGLEALGGKPLSLESASLRPLKDSLVLAVLLDLAFADSADRAFYWWNGAGTLGD